MRSATNLLALNQRVAGSSPAAPTMISKTWIGFDLCNLLRFSRWEDYGKMDSPHAETPQQAQRRLITFLRTLKRTEVLWERREALRFQTAVVLRLAL